MLSITSVRGFAALLRLPEVMARVGLSRSEIYRRIAAGTFPAPVKLGDRASAWAEHEVVAWCEARVAARDSAAPDVTAGDFLNSQDLARITANPHRLAKIRGRLIRVANLEDRLEPSQNVRGGSDE